MAPPPLPAAVTVHDLEQAVAALRAAAAIGKPVTLLSAPAAAAQAGINWFAELVKTARAEVPDADCVGALDCDRYGGRAMAALKLGFEVIIFSGQRANYLTLLDMADGLPIRVLDSRPKSLDLLGRREPEKAVRDWLAKR